jgi:hypothetical protein
LVVGRKDIISERLFTCQSKIIHILFFINVPKSCYSRKLVQLKISEFSGFFLRFLPVVLIFKKMIFSSDNLIWTQHSLAKLKQYRLSASRVLRVLRHPKRKEIGVAENTMACMQTAGTTKNSYEIWVMTTQISNPKSETRNSKQIQNTKIQNSKRSQKIKIISAWRYPGVSPIGEPPPIPEELWEELNKSDKRGINSSW